MIKKLTLILIVVILFGFQNVFAAEGSDNEDFTREEKIITSLGIVADETKDTLTTRSGFVCSVLKLMNYTVTENKKEESVFRDVKTNISQINTAYSMGLISGYKGNFYPDNSITAVEAGLILIKVMGYNAVLEMNSDYPENCIAVVNKTGLFKGTGIKDYAAAISYEQAVRMIYNALEENVLYYESNYGYKTDKDETVLSKYLNVHKGKGIVQADRNTNITTTDIRPGANEVLIDGAVFDVGTTEAENLLGMPVKYYYSYNKNDDIKTLLYIEAEECKTERIISGQLIGPGSTDRVVYEKDGRCKEIHFPENMTVIYNGKMCINLSATDFQPPEGELYFIDNNNDSDYDILFITSYNTVIVKNVDDKGIVLDELTGGFIDFNDYHDVILTDGKTDIEFSAISVGDLLSIAESKDGSFAEIVLSTDRINGSITQKSDEMIMINEKEYNLSPYFISNSGNIKFDVRVKDVVSAYLNPYGEVVFCKVYTTTVRNAVIVNAYEMEEGDGYTLKMVDREAGVVRYMLAPRVKINGSSYKADKIGVALNQIMSDTYYGVVPVLYEVNDEGEINVIESPKGSMLGVLCNDEKKYYASEANTFLRNTEFGDFCAGSSTFFCYVPEDPDATDDYVIKSQQDMITDMNKNICAFSADNSRIADIVLVKGGTSSSVGETENLAIVKKKHIALNSDDEVVDVLTVMKGGKEVQVQSKEAGVFSGVEKGDIIYYSLNMNGVVEGIAEIYKAGDVGIYQSPVNAKGRFAGTVYYQEGEVLGISTTDPVSDSDIVYINLFNKPNIYVYDSDEDEARLGSVDDVTDFLTAGSEASKIFVQTRYTVVKNVVIYK